QRVVMKVRYVWESLDALEAKSSRNELVRILSALYRACSVDEIEPITYLIQGRLAPFFAPVEIGLGERLLVSAIAMAYGTPKDEVTRLYRRAGDLGVTAQRFAPSTEPDPPPVNHVHPPPSPVPGTPAPRELTRKTDP